MRTRDNDTVPDPRPTPASSGDPSDPGVSGGSSPSSASRQNISEPEPMDLLLRKVVQATPDVPNSLEPGVAYQATHSPAAPYGRPELDERVLVQPTTEPGPPPMLREDGSLPRLQVETMAIPRRRASANKIAIVTFAVVVLIGGVIAFAVVGLRPATHVNGPVPIPSTSPVVVASGPSVPASPVAPPPNTSTPPPPPVTTVAASVTASSPRLGRPPQSPTMNAVPRPRPAPTANELPPSSLMNQAPL